MISLYYNRECLKNADVIWQKVIPMARSYSVSYSNLDSALYEAKLTSRRFTAIWFQHIQYILPLVAFVYWWEQWEIVLYLDFA